MARSIRARDATFHRSTGPACTKAESAGRVSAVDGTGLWACTAAGSAIRASAAPAISPSAATEPKRRHGSVAALRTTARTPLGFNELRDVKSGIRDHPKVGFIPLTGCGQVAVAEERVRGIQRERLQLSQVDLPPAGHANIPGGVHEPHHGQGAEAIVRRETRALAQRGTRPGVEEVDRD